MASVEYAFGCRHPESSRMDRRDALVITKCVENNTPYPLTSILFTGGTHFVGHVLSCERALLKYDERIASGWVAMDVEDLEVTCGIRVVATASQAPSAGDGLDTE